MTKDADQRVGSKHSPPPASRGRFERRDWWVLAAVFLAGLTVRGLYLYQAADSPTFRAPVVDAMTYHFNAVQLAGPAHRMDPGYFWQPFFYPFLLAGIYFFTGTSILAAKVVGILLGAGTCAMTYALGRKIFNRRVGLLAAGMVVFYGPLVFWECDLMGDWLAAFWSLVILLLLLRARETNGGPWTCFALGLSGVLGILTRPTVLPFFVVSCAVLGWQFYRRPAGRRQRVGAGRNVLAGFLLVALPFLWLSYDQTGRIALLPSSGGINMYIGNNGDMCRTLTVRPGYQWEQLTTMPQRAGVDPEDYGAQQAYYYRLVRKYVFHQPLSFLRGLGAKTLRFLSAREIPRNVDVYMFRQWSPLLSVLVWRLDGFAFPFGVLLPLTVVGAVLCWRSIPAYVWVFLVLYPVAVILVFIAGRYRIPVVPVMAVVAAGGVFALGDLLRRGRVGALAAMVVVMAATVALASLPGPFCEEKIDYAAELANDLGVVHYEFGNAARHREKAYAEWSIAADYFAEAIRLGPDYADAYNNLGLCHARRGQMDEAIACFRQALEHNPKLARALTNIGAVERGRGRLDEAMAALRQALAIDDTVGLAHYHMAAALLTDDRPDEAVEHLRKTAILDGNAAHRLWAWCELADAQARDGRGAEAVAAYWKALKTKTFAEAPPAAKARALKGAAWLLSVWPDATLRNGSDALKMAAHAARMQKDDPDALDILAAAYAEMGQFQSAVAYADKAVQAAERVSAPVEMVQAIRTRQRLYRAGQPCRRAEPYPFFRAP